MPQGYREKEALMLRAVALVFVMVILVCGKVLAVSAPSGLTATAQALDQTAVLVWNEDPTASQWYIYLDGIQIYTPLKNNTSLVTPSRRQYVLRTLPRFTNISLTMKAIASGVFSTSSSAIAITCCPAQTVTVTGNVNVRSIPYDWVASVTMTGQPQWTPYSVSATAQDSDPTAVYRVWVVNEGDGDSHWYRNSASIAGLIQPAWRGNRIKGEERAGYIDDVSYNQIFWYRSDTGSDGRLDVLRK